MIMKILIKSLKLVLFLGSLSALIYFRSIIFQPEINKNIDTGLAFVEQKLDIEIPYHPAEVKEAQLVSEKECKSVEINVVASSVESDDVIKAVEAESTPDNSNTAKTDIMDDLSTVADVINEKVESLFVVENNETVKEKAVEEVSSLTSSSEDLVATAPKIVTDPKSAFVDLPKMLSMARQAFWKGNLHESEKRYQDMINIDDSNPDSYGELGNLYYTQGKWEQAGEAYYQAAERLLASNNAGENDSQKTSRLNYLLRVIQGLDTERADKLRNKISE